MWVEFAPTLVIMGWAVFIVALERRYPYDRQRFFRYEFWTDLLWFSIAFSYIAGWIVFVFVIPGLDHWTNLSSFDGIRRWPLWVQVLLSLITHDLFIYVFHRAMHRHPALWRLHECHHSVQEVDWAGGSRGHIFENIITGTAEFAPIVLFMSPEVALIKPAIDACWGMWIHSNCEISLGRLNYVINGPLLHRWHHSRDVRDVNFATKFAFWDFVLGTAYWPKDRKPTSYGLDVDFPRNILEQQWFAFRRPNAKAADASVLPIVPGPKTPAPAGTSGPTSIGRPGH